MSRVQQSLHNVMATYKNKGKTATLIDTVTETLTVEHFSYNKITLIGCCFACRSNLQLLLSCFAWIRHE